MERWSGLGEELCCVLRAAECFVRECASSDVRFQGSLWHLGRKFVVEEQGRKRKTGRRLRNSLGARGLALDMATEAFLMSGVLS